MNTSELKLRMLSLSVIACLGFFTTLVFDYALGINAEQLDNNVRIFIGMVIMAIFLNIMLHRVIKGLEKEDKDIYEYE